VRVQYTPTVEDVFRLKQALAGRLRRHPAILSLAIGSVLLVCGGTAMAATGSASWSVLAFGGVALGAVTWVAVRKAGVTREQVEKDFAALAWMHHPYVAEIDDEGLSYEHGPYRARLRWTRLARCVETDHHLVLMEKPGAAAMAYGLAKRELDKADGTEVWKAVIARHIRH
jgi:hypothetical protein